MGGTLISSNWGDLREHLLKEKGFELGGKGWARCWQRVAGCVRRHYTLEETASQLAITAWEICLLHCFWNTHTHSLLRENTTPVQILSLKKYFLPDTNHHHPHSREGMIILKVSIYLELSVWVCSFKKSFIDFCPDSMQKIGYFNGVPDKTDFDFSLM